MICPMTKQNISEEYEPKYCSHSKSSCHFCDVITKEAYEFALLFPMDERTVRAYEKQEKKEVIDVEPHWKNLVPAYLEAIKHGDEVQYAIAKNDIMRMAEICDRIRQTQKRGVTMVRVGSDYKSNGRPVGRPKKEKL